MNVTQSKRSCSLDPDHRHGKMCYRVFILVLAVCMVFSCTFSASAAVEFTNGYGCIDLMYGSDIKYGSLRNEYIYTYSGYDSIGFVSRRVFYNWTPPNINYDISTIYLSFYSTEYPDSILLYTSSSASSIAGSVTGVNGNYYEYRFTGIDDITDLTFNFRFNAAGARYITLNSCVGFGQVYESLEAFNYFQYCNYTESIEGIPTISRSTVFSNYNCAVPFSRTHHEYESDFDWKYDDVYIDIPSWNRNAKNYKTLHVLFDYVGVVDNVGASLYVDSSMDPIVILDQTDVGIYSFSSRNDSTLGPADWTMSTGLISVDLEGVYLDGYTIDVNFTLDPLGTGASPSDYYNYINIRQIWFEPVITEEAWYVRLWHWMSGGFQSIVEKLDELFGDSSGGALSDAGDAMSDQAAAMDEAQSQMDSVDRPSVDADSMLSGFVNFDTGGLSVLSVLTSNAVVTPMLTVVFTFALCGYIFFGKKG